VQIIIRHLDHDDIARLADAIDPRYRALILLLAYSGLRIGEATALRRRDLDGASVAVRSTAVEVRGRLVEQPPKTRAGRRTVPLPQTVADALRSHLEQYSQPGPARVSCSRRLRASQCVCLRSERERSLRPASERTCQVCAFMIFGTRL
jgi:integrase